MKVLRALAVLFAASVATLTTLQAGPSLDQRAAAARQAIGDFAVRLKTELMNAMQSGGPKAAIGVCNVAAPALAGEASARLGGYAGRTSTKLRNPGNAADAWELQVLADFERRKAAGEPLDALERFEIVKTAGRDEFRYMKAIGMQPPCLACHGRQIAPDIAAAIKELYPADRATGYAPGDIRGAFTIRQPVD